MAAAKEMIKEFIGNNPGLERAFSTISMALEKMQQYIRDIILKSPLPPNVRQSEILYSDSIIEFMFIRIQPGGGDSY